MHACTCMCTCLGTSPMTPDAPQPICPLARATGSRREPKSPKIYKSWTNQDNLILFEKSFLNSSRLTLITLDTLHPPAPPPWSQRSCNLKNAIKHERIKIIELCLKICDPWALLHTYRLGLMCRWGGIPSQMALLCFEPKKVRFSLLRLPR